LTGYNSSFIFYLAKTVYIALRKLIVDSLYSDSDPTKEDTLEGENAH
jgi:hypothetical protein